MEACLAVEREVDKVLAKFNDVDRQTVNIIQNLVGQIENIKEELIEVPGNTNLTPGQSLVLSQCLKKLRETLSKISGDHRDLHSSVSKVGKAIDRNFVSDFTSVFTDGAFTGDGRRDELNKVIVEHFLRQGMLDISETLVQDCQMDVDQSQRAPFLELHRILEALKLQDLTPALLWAEQNRECLRSQNSSLEFKLHRLRFIELIREGPSKQREALLYARNFEPFAYSHVKELQVLMGSMLYVHQGIEHSPYSHLLDPVNWAEICDVFTRDACSLLGLSVESPLSVVVRAGCEALPPLLNIKQVMQQRQCSGVWSAKDELPVEIDLGTDCSYHSIFACPILRQQSTDNNPPVRLVCGHVISRDALNKLANGNKVKCPYCPVEQSPGDARQIFF